MKTIIDKNTGKVLYGTLIEFELIESEIAIDELLTENMENPYFDFETKVFYNKTEELKNNIN
jgi:hypothetical protein